MDIGDPFLDVGGPFLDIWGLDSFSDVQGSGFILGRSGLGVEIIRVHFWTIGVARTFGVRTFVVQPRMSENLEFPKKRTSENE